MTPQQQTAFASADNNALYEAITGALRDFIEAEVQNTLLLETQGEHRAYSAGRASSATDFLTELEWMKKQAEALAEKSQI